MDAFTTFTFGTSAWLSLQSLPLLFTPKLIVSMLATDPRRITDLEAYLCRTLGLTLLTLAVTSIVLTGIIPLSPLPSPSSDDNDGNAKNPYAYPTLVISTIYHALSAFYLYTQLTFSFNFAFAAGVTGSSALFCVGLWVVLFGSERGKISKSTGADKRTSNFPFENKESAREKKKEGREKEGKEGKRRSILKSR